MSIARFFVVAFLLAAACLPARADDILDAVDAGRKAYQAGDLGTAKQKLDLASQLIGQKNAEALTAFLPQPLSGWTADKAEAQSVGQAMFGGATMASRTYRDSGGNTVEVSITGDSAMLTAIAPMLANPMLAGAMGKLVRVGDLTAIQTATGDVTMVVNNKFVVTVHGSADAAAKLSYAKAVDVAKLSKL